MGSTGPSELLRGLLVVVVSERMNFTANPTDKKMPQNSVQGMYSAVEDGQYRTIRTAQGIVGSCSF